MDEIERGATLGVSSHESLRGAGRKTRQGRHHHEEEQEGIGGGRFPPPPRFSLER